MEYMKWKSEETLAAYQHYFDALRDADTRNALQQRLHAEVQHYLDERRRGKPGKLVQRQPTDVASVAPPVSQFDGEPNLAFLYSLAGEG
jgi:hypothetical protein